MNPSNNPDGRPTLLTKELITIITNMAQQGVDNRSICEFVNVSEPTFYRWLKRADDFEAPEIYVEFRKSLSRAQSMSKQKALKSIWRAMDTDWHAAKYILGIRDPQYQENRKVSLGGQENNPVQFEDVTFEIGSEELGIIDGNPNED